MKRLDPSPRLKRIVLVSCLLVVTPSLGALPDIEPEIDAAFLEAGENLIMPAGGGWPLTLSLTLNEAELQGIGGPPGTFPATDQTGHFVFEDPDGCPSWDQPFMQNLHREVAGPEPPEYPSAYRRCASPPPLPWPEDEKLLEVTPGRARPPALLEECSYLEILSYDLQNRTNTLPAAVGPCLGNDYGFGSNPRLPGLVVVADHGPGVLTDELFNRPSPIAARNLAGLFESVAYALRDAQGRTTVVAAMNVPAALFSPLVQVDEHPGSWCGGGPGPIVRVDGGPATCDLDPIAVYSRQVTVRAFIVNGQAPDLLVDVDHDGVIDIRDARAAGLVALSAETQIRFRQHHDPSQFWPIYYDLDGNGEAGTPPPAPAGPADLTHPPR